MWAEPVRLFNLFDEIKHVLLAYLEAADENRLVELNNNAVRLGDSARFIVVTPGTIPPRPRLRIVRDERGAFAAAYGVEARAFLVRPDGYIAWRGRDIPGWTDRPAP